MAPAHTGVQKCADGSLSITTYAAFPPRRSKSCSTSERPIRRLKSPFSARLFGVVPSGRTLEKLDFASLRPVLMAIQRSPPDEEPPLTAPSRLKLQNNALSGDAVALLRQGRRRQKLVQDFFDAWPDPSFGEDIAQGFRTRYQSLKAVGLGPDQIFCQLQAFAGGMDGEPSHQGAVLAILSYFFELCDIFEDAL